MHHISKEEFRLINWLPTSKRVDQCINTITYNFDLKAVSDLNNTQCADENMCICICVCIYRCVYIYTYENILVHSPLICSFSCVFLLVFFFFFTLFSFLFWLEDCFCPFCTIPAIIDAIHNCLFFVVFFYFG